MTKGNEQTDGPAPATAARAPGRMVGETGSAPGQVLSSARNVSHQAEGLRGEVIRLLGEVRAA